MSNFPPKLDNILQSNKSKEKYETKKQNILKYAFIRLQSCVRNLHQIEKDAEEFHKKRRAQFLTYIENQFMEKAKATFYLLPLIILKTKIKDLKQPEILTDNLIKKTPFEINEKKENIYGKTEKLDLFNSLLTEVNMNQEVLKQSIDSINSILDPKIPIKIKSEKIQEKLSIVKKSEYLDPMNIPLESIMQQTDQINYSNKSISGQKPIIQSDFSVQTSKMQMDFSKKDNLLQSIQKYQKLETLDYSQSTEELKKILIKENELQSSMANMNIVEKGINREITKNGDYECKTQNDYQDYNTQTSTKKHFLSFGPEMAISFKNSNDQENMHKKIFSTNLNETSIQFEGLKKEKIDHENSEIKKHSEGIQVVAENSEVTKIEKKKKENKVNSVIIEVVKENEENLNNIINENLIKSQKKRKKRSRKTKKKKEFDDIRNEENESKIRSEENIKVDSLKESTGELLIENGVHKTLRKNKKKVKSTDVE